MMQQVDSISLVTVRDASDIAQAQSAVVLDGKCTSVLLKQKDSALVITGGVTSPADIKTRRWR